MDLRYRLISPIAEGSASEASSPMSSENSGNSPQTVTTSLTIVTSPLSPGRLTFGSPLTLKSEESGCETASPIEEEELPLIKAEPGTSASSTDLIPSIKKPRGRPRKNLLQAEPFSDIKTPKGRSKTGCYTCRRRKKKCDERKPTCLHCEKNRVHCEGYPPVELWQSGKQKAAIRRNIQKWETIGPPPLPNLFPFIEDDLDNKIFNHFSTFSSVLSLNKGKDNPFQDILLPMAMRHQGLMHMLLSLSGTHLRQTLQEGDQRLTDRIELHFEKGQQSIHEALELDDHTLALATLNCLRTIVVGHHYGEWAPNLEILRYGIGPGPGVNSAFRRFLAEFFIYHKTASILTSSRPWQFDYVNLPGFIDNNVGAFLGVCDGIIMSIARVREIRDHIRTLQQEQGFPSSSTEKFPCVDYESIAQAREIEMNLRNCACTHEMGTEMWLCWQLYRISAWLYMYRTVYNSKPSEQLEDAFQKALGCLKDIDADSGCQSVLLTPIFMLGCAAFNKEHRQPILDALNTIEQYSALGNIKHARTIVLRIWELMDSDDPRERERSWDWEGIMDDMGLNLLIT